MLSYPQRDGQPFIIYALVCPIAQDVKYVGQTVNLDIRIQGHGPRRHSGAMRDWLLSLGKEHPIVVVLERGVNRRVRLRVSESRGRRRRKHAWTYIWLSTVRETVWQLRHRRTLLNKAQVESSRVAQLLTNPPLPWDEGYEYEREDLGNGVYRITPVSPHPAEHPGWPSNVDRIP